MNDRVVIMRATEAVNSYGDPVATWTVLAQVWAGIEWMAGSEAVAGEREYSEVPVSVKVRRSSDTMSVREKDRVFVPMGATTLDAFITASDTSVSVEDAGAFPPEHEFLVRIRDELVLCSSVSSDTLTVTRASFGSTASSHAYGTAAIHMAPLDIVSVAPDRARGMLNLTATRGEVRTTT